MKEELKQKLQEAGVLAEVETYVKSEKQTSFDAGVGNAYGQVDEAVSEEFGTTKQEKQFTTEYLKSASKLFKQDVEMNTKKQYESVESEIKILKEKLKTDPDTIKKEYDDLRKTHNETLKKFEIEKQEITKSFERNITQSKLMTAVSSIEGLKFPDEKFKQWAVGEFAKRLETDGLLSVMVEQDGKLILKGGEKHGHKDFVLNELAQEEFKSYIQAQEPNPAQGRQNEPAPINTKIATAKTKGEAVGMIRDSLVSSGAKITDADWDKKYTAEIEANKLVLEKLE